MHWSSPACDPLVPAKAGRVEGYAGHVVLLCDGAYGASGGEVSGNHKALVPAFSACSDCGSDADAAQNSEEWGSCWPERS